MQKQAKANPRQYADHYKAIAQRIVNAHADFLDVVCERTGCTREDAGKAFDTLKKHRLIKLDGSRYTVTHGIYLEPDVLRNAMRGDA